MKPAIAIALLACCLSAPLHAQQTNPDPTVKTGDGKAASAKQKTDKSSCAGMQGGVDASGGENVEQHAKSSKTSNANSAACGKHNGKASAPEAAPTTADPAKDPVLK